jgi:hypothetical protein
MLRAQSRVLGEVDPTVRGDHGSVDFVEQAR